jgi:hypothetical protein
MMENELRELQQRTQQKTRARVMRNAGILIGSGLILSEWTVGLPRAAILTAGFVAIILMLFGEVENFRA